MRWKFTPDDLVKGEVDYTIYEFRRDLWEEISEDGDIRDFDSLFWTLYHLAIGDSANQIASRIRQENDLTREETADQLRQFEKIRTVYSNDIEMFKAIIKRRLLDYKQEGVDVFSEQSVAEYLQTWITEISNTHPEE